MSDSHHFERAMAIFDEVCDRPPDERRALLAERCGGDARLRAEVESLLEHDAAPGGVVADVEAGAGVEWMAASLAAAAAPERIGRYRIIREVGHGGMGVVYEAEQESPKRRVAIKVIRPGAATRDLLRRFRHEAQILGHLTHPGIAHIYEAGSATVGDATLPYIAMEFVEGDRLDVYAERRALSTRDRMELVARVCDAVQHAHLKGVIHRDLKPANILVVEGATGSRSGSAAVADSLGQPKALDFGIARVTDPEIQTTTIHTSAGQIVGTLGYMAPEQIEGASADIDARCDVYALGAILYRLVSGRAPHDLAGRPIPEAARIVKEVEPPTLGSIDASLRGDIQTIVARAMEKDPARRYASAGELAEDIRRHLRDEPIRAHPPSALYQFRKFARRHTALVTSVAAGIAAVFVGLIGTISFLIEAQRQRDEAISAQSRLEEVVEFQADLLSGLDVRTVGRGLIDDLREDFRRGLDEEDLTEETKAAAVAEFDEMLERINSVNLAREVLEGTIAARAKSRIDEGVTEDPLIAAELRGSLGRIYRGLGLSDKACEQYAIARDLLVGRVGGDDPRTIEATFYLGQSHALAGERGEAERFLRLALDGQRRVLPPDDPWRHRTLNTLGDVLRGMRRFDEAKACYQEVIDAAGKTLAPDHGHIVNAKNNLAVLLIDEGDAESAYRLFVEVLEARRRTDGEDHTVTITARNNIMTALFRLERPAEAESYGREVLASYARLHGDGHPSTIMARNNLGRILFDTGRAEESLEFLLRVYEDGRTSLSPTHEVRLKGMGNLIDALTALSRCEEAEDYARELLETRRAMDPPNPFQVSNALEQLGICLIEQERFAEAEPCLRECVAIREGINSGHWLTHWARSLLGASLAGLGRGEEAEGLLVASAEALENQRDEIAPFRREGILASAHAHARSASGAAQGQ